MKFEEKEVTLRNGTACILRSPVPADAVVMIEYLKMTSGESPFMIRYPEEVTISVEEEVEILENRLKSESDFFIAAFIHEEMAGSIGVSTVGTQYKLAHRCSLGIAIKQKFWNLGIGNILLQEALSQAGKVGYEQIELGVFSDNDKAMKLYEKFGFEVWGKIKNASRLKDGTYQDEIMMGKFLG